MLTFEQKISARHRLFTLRARYVHKVEAKGYEMKFAVVSADVEIEARDPVVLGILKRRLSKRKFFQVRKAPEVAAITDCLRNIQIVSAPKPVSSVAKPGLPQSALVPANNAKLYEPSEVKANSPPCHSPGAILPDLPQNGSEETDKNGGLSKEADACETKGWLTQNRFSQHLATFANFSGADLLRLSRDDIIQICGLADGIRLFNALHAKPIEPRLTVYVCAAGSNVYSALYLHSRRASELLAKLNALFGNEFECVLVSGPGGARVRLTDDVVRHMPDGPTYGADVLAADAALLLTPARN